LEVPDPESIRAQYEKHGARDFYSRSGPDYRNPHEPQLRRCIELAVKTWRPNLFQVLDLAAGSGEATLVLRDLGATRVDGIDPYTADAYLARTGNAAERFTFEDVAAGALAGRYYSLIVCSFALHLCESSRLPSVCQQLSLVGDALLVVTPHKRPLIKPEWGWAMVGEQVVERVRARMYSSSAE
jgi:SAM-dependent methyltransferase